MIELKLELYSGPIDSNFSHLPGHVDDLKESIYWAVLIAQPPAGSAMANWIQAEPPSTTYPEGTNGTETLPAATTHFIVSQVCVTHHKDPPYTYKPVTPDGTDIAPLPIGFGDGSYYCVTPPPSTDGIGIWIVHIDKFRESSPNAPGAPAGGRAVFPPGDLRRISQPLLIIRGDIPTDGVRCPDLRNITADRDCFSRGESETFTVGYYDPDSAIGGYTWEFRHTSGTSLIRTSYTNSIAVTFDDAWDAGNWTVIVTATVIGADPSCGFAITSDNIFDFSILEGVCPTIDYLEAVPNINNPCQYTFEVRVSGDYSGTRLIWNFGDGTTADQNVTSPITTQTHLYSGVPSNGVLVTVDLDEINSCCSPQHRERWIELPQDGCRSTRCRCSEWVNGECVGNNRRRQVRKCDPPGCDDESRIVHDTSCDGGNGGGWCGGLVWAAVIILALGITLLAFHTCIPPISTILFVVGIGLVVLYGVLIAVWRLLEWLGICSVDKCTAAAIHMIILGPLGVGLTIAALFSPCFWPPVWWIYGPIAGFWGAVDAACRLFG